MNRRELFRDLTGMSAAPTADAPRPLPYRSATRAGIPRQYARGDRMYITSAGAWLCYDSIGFYAVEAFCPHLGCLLRPTVDGFACPCHHSRFSEAGEPTAGPAARELRYFYVDLDARGHLVIYRNRRVDPEDRLMV